MLGVYIGVLLCFETTKLRRLEVRATKTKDMLLKWVTGFRVQGGYSKYSEGWQKEVQLHEMKEVLRKLKERSCQQN